MTEHPDAKAAAAEAFRKIDRSTALPRPLQPLVDPTAVHCVGYPRSRGRGWDDR